MSAHDFLPYAELDRDCAHAWLIPVQQHTAPDAAQWSVLDAAELRRVLAFRDETDGWLYAKAHAWLRNVLGAATGRDPASLAFGRAPGGKPFLLQPAGEPRLYCNLSHTRGCIAVALCWQCEVGIDVERVEALDEIGPLAAQVLHADELARFSALATGERLRTFFRWWTAKEACAKATGGGLAHRFCDLRLQPGQDACETGCELYRLDFAADGVSLSAMQIRSGTLHAAEGIRQVEYAFALGALDAGVPWVIHGSQGSES